MFVRSANFSDLPGILSADSYAEESEKRHTELRKWLREKSIWVAEDSSRVLGFVAVDDSFFGQSFVHLICVSPSMRRTGIAMSLLVHVELHTPARKLFTSTNSSNVVAQKLFERAGFVRSGIIENLDRDDPEYIYFKPSAQSAEA